MKILLAMEGDGLSLDFTILDVDLIAAEDNRDVLAHTDEILVPRGHVLVRDTRCHVEHDDGALALDVVAIAKTSELLLTGCVPHVECDRTAVGSERQRVNFHTQCRHVLLLELACQVAFYECCLAYTTVAHQYQLQFQFYYLFTIFLVKLLNY